MGPKPIFCYVPFNSLTFSFRGDVYACTYNRDILLGSYPKNSIDEIWNSSEAQKLRDHMRHNDLDYGCHHCKYFFEKEKFSNLKPLVFDKYSKVSEKQFPKVLEFEMSNECNLECQMCIGEVSSSIRKNRDKLPPIEMVYDKKFVDQLEKYIPHLDEAKFFGGEPFLISIYYDIWESISRLNPDISMFLITNGTHWNSKIRKVLSKGKFDIAISIDAVDKTILEKIRKNVSHEKLMTNIDNFANYAKENGRHISLSFTAQQDNWREFPKIIELCNSKEAFVYVSYLERPDKFAISGMRKAELIKIRTYLEEFSFLGTEDFETHNKKCYQDFKDFIQKYIDNKEEKKYEEYWDDRELSSSAESKTNGPSSIDAVAPIIKYEIQLQAIIDNEEQLLEINNKPLLTKFNHIISAYSEQEKILIKKSMLNDNPKQVLTHIKERPLEIISRDIQRVLEKASHD